MFFSYSEIEKKQEPILDPSFISQTHSLISLGISACLLK
jgi:hypothetical protein